jgi:phosphotriesterase-related protein
MTASNAATHPTVHTVLGPVPAGDLGVVSVHEGLLSVLPGAQYAYDITIDRAEVFDRLERRLVEFREA